jgi:hypothetical protein
MRAEEGADVLHYTTTVHTILTHCIHSYERIWRTRPKQRLKRQSGPVQKTVLCSITVRQSSTVQY